MDAELINQIDFLTKRLNPSVELNKLQIIRLLVKEKIDQLGLWTIYTKSKKLYSEKELFVKN